VSTKMPKSGRREDNLSEEQRAAKLARRDAKREARRALDRQDADADLESVEYRLEFFDRSRQVASFLGLSTVHGSFVVSTTDPAMGRSLFSKRGRPEFRVLERATAAIAILGGGQIPAGSVFIDVGANIGTSAVSALCSYGFASAIVCEPEPGSRRLLKANLALNGLEDRATVVPDAVSDRAGSAKLVSVEGRCNSWLAADEETLKSILAGAGILAAAMPRMEADGKAAVIVDEIQITTLDDIVARASIEADEVGLLWVDAEGHEGHVLRGASRLVEAGIPSVFEFDPLGLESRGDRESLHRLVEECYTHFLDLRRQVEPGVARFMLRPITDLRSHAERFMDKSSRGHFTDVLVVRLEHEQSKALGKDFPRLMREYRARADAEA
jgi:FkbM family methyltransferase